MRKIQYIPHNLSNVPSSEMAAKHAKHAAMTIISKNYISYAKTLAQSYRKFYPDHDFIIILVDKPDQHVNLGFHDFGEIISFESLHIPDLTNFIYRYTILEINTAVKPYALFYLFKKWNYESIVYFDPDIVIYSKLTDVYESLKKASIVLTPHIQEPYNDELHPSELNILQSGIFNLGFIALKNTDTTLKFLDWWKRKLYMDCIIEIESGLFVDQKWIDLVPCYFSDYNILYDKTCNVAYWNLHERNLQYKNKTWIVDDRPLVFYHFSGFSPLEANRLSKHQTRHKLESMPDLKLLTDNYAHRLHENGFSESYKWTYSFSKLRNGVTLPMNIVCDIMKWSTKKNIGVPDPIKEPDSFCSFLFSKGLIREFPDTALIYYFLLKRRRDVAKIFPDAWKDTSDPGFQSWLKSSGIKEEGLNDLMQFDTSAVISNYVGHLFDTLQKGNRTDVLDAYAHIWDDNQCFVAFSRWVTNFGVAEMGLTPAHSLNLLDSRRQIHTILNIYFADENVQREFPALHTSNHLYSFVSWLAEHREHFPITPDGISLFQEFVKSRPERIALMLFLYRQDTSTITPNIYAITEILEAKKLNITFESVMKMFITSDCIEPADTVREQCLHCVEPHSLLDDSSVHSFMRKAQERINARQDVINVAGYWNVPSGMGESMRSMCAILTNQCIEHRIIRLPHVRSECEIIPSRPELFGWPCATATASILVVNADSVETSKRFLPRTFWSAKNIGYWVWETEKLPEKFAVTASHFDEIWTPSTYSAAGIAATVDKKVVVMPHIVDISMLQKAKANRKYFGLPETGTLFGFIFDPASVLERKNIKGLIHAFETAFCKSDNTYLILKVNGVTRKSYEYEELRSSVQNSNILFLEKTFHRQENFDFMASLDAYVSLHRSEGFGLTLAEAMALGKPVIASRYSGNLDFMNDSNSILITTRRIQTDRAYGPYPAGTVWGEPDVEEAAARMREVRKQCCLK